jgi:hypothetical protein
MRSRIHNSSVNTSEITSRGRRGVFLCALFGLPLTSEQLALYTKYTGRTTTDNTTTRSLARVRRRAAGSHRHRQIARAGDWLEQAPEIADTERHRVVGSSYVIDVARSVDGWRCPLSASRRRTRTSSAPSHFFCAICAPASNTVPVGDTSAAGTASRCPVSPSKDDRGAHRSTH